MPLAGTTVQNLHILPTSRWVFSGCSILPAPQVPRPCVLLGALCLGGPSLSVGVSSGPLVKF